MSNGRMTGKEMRELASKVGASIEELAREAGLSSQVLYRKPKDKQFARKSTCQLIEAANRIAAKIQVKAG